MTEQPARRTQRDPPSKPAPRPLIKRPWFRLLVLVAVCYVAWCVALYVFQDGLLFPADMAPQPLPGLYDATTRAITIGTDEGTSVAWFLPAPDLKPDRPAPVVVYFHGNAEIIDYQSTIVEGYRMRGCSVLLPEYRGYGRCDGTPGERAIVADAVRFYDLLITWPEVDADRIVFHGRSLGGGPAAQLAARRTPAALILESTFTSAAAMAHAYFAPMFLAKHPFRTDRVLAGLDIPVLIFHGTRDDIIPVAHGRRLREIDPDAVYIEYDCRHNDFPGPDNEEAYWAAIEKFLGRSGILKAETTP